MNEKIEERATKSMNRARGIDFEARRKQEQK